MDYKKIAKEVFEIESSGLLLVGRNIDENFSKAVELVLKSKGRFVITGMGKSGLVGKKIAATLASTGTRSLFIHPGEAYHGDLGMISELDIVLAISNSGETEEIIKLLSFFKDNGNSILGMTAKKDSTLAKYSDVFLNIGIEKEACPLELAPTTSTTVTMAYGDALAIALMKAKSFKPESFAKFHPGGSLGKKLLTLVKDTMVSKNLPQVSKGASFDQIISSISEGRLGLTVVTEGDNKILGVITDGDLRRILKENKEKALSMSAEQFNLKKPITITKDEKIVRAEQIMNDKKITALVVEKNGQLEGVLHLYDL